MNDFKTFTRYAIEPFILLMMIDFIMPQKCHIPYSSDHQLLNIFPFEVA